MNKWTFGNILSGLTKELQVGYLENPDIFQRREYFKDISEYTSGNIVLTRKKYYDFINFYKNILREGTMPFEYCDCLTGGNLIMSFTAKPEAIETSGFYTVSIQVRVL